MAIDKTQLTNNRNVTSLLGIGGKSVTSVTMFRYGVTTVVDILAAGTHYYIKERGGQIEVGGTEEWNTGTVFG